MMRGTSRGSLRTRTTSPASTATSVPAPIATPTVGRRERRRVVHPVTDHGDALPLPLELLDLRRLRLGQYLREHEIDPECPCDGISDRLGIPGQHGDLHPELVQTAHRSG